MRLPNILISLILLFSLATPLSAEDCYESRIISPYPFMGNDGEVFKLADGSQWKVVQEKIFLFMYEYYPKVLICPTEGQLMVGGNIIPVEKNRPTTPSDAIDSL